MTAGRPRQVSPELLYTVAQRFYGDFRRLAEGKSRRLPDEEKYRQLIDNWENSQFIGDDEKKRHKEIVDREIQTGRLEVTRREERLREIEDYELSANRDLYRISAAKASMKQLKIPGEPDVLNALLQATPQQVRRICKDAFVRRRFEVQPGVFKEGKVRNWPIALGSTLPRYLSQYANEFVAALNDSRFPRCDVSRRPTNRLKQLWFLSRALAGAVLGVKTRTAINLVGSKRPEQIFEESRAGKSVRKRAKRRRGRDDRKR